MQRILRAVVCITTALAVLVVAGCANDKNKMNSSMQGISKDQAEDMNAANSKFDNAKDPPLTAETHFAAGQLADVQGAFDRGITQYQAALKIKPNYPEALFRLGIDYM